LWAGPKGVPVGEPKSLRLKMFSLAVFSLEKLCSQWDGSKDATQIDSVLLGDEQQLQIIVDAANVVRFVSF
jgi:hypothetical protein